MQNASPAFLRELDRQAVRNIVGIFNDAGMGIVKRHQGKM